MSVKRSSIVAVSRIRRSVIEVYVKSGELEDLLMKLGAHSLELVPVDVVPRFVLWDEKVAKATVTRLAFLVSLSRTRNLTDCILEGYPESIVSAVLLCDPSHAWTVKSKWDRLESVDHAAGLGNIQEVGSGITVEEIQGGLKRGREEVRVAAESVVEGLYPPEDHFIYKNPPEDDCETAKERCHYHHQTPPEDHFVGVGDELYTEPWDEARGYCEYTADQVVAGDSKEARWPPFKRKSSGGVEANS